MEELKGRAGIVTGASSGIGYAIAETLAGAGATVYVISRTGAVKEDMEPSHPNVVHKKGDVTDYDAMKAMIADLAASHNGTLDFLVNNAGVTRDNLVARMSEEDYDHVMDINLKGAFHTIRHLTRYFLKQRKGKIVNISSVSGVAGNAGQANYAASKAGLIGLTKSVAKELAGRNICVNAVAPGFIETEMTQALPQKTREAAVASIPMGRMGSPRDVAELVAFLAGDRSDYITGQVICVDGGIV